MLRPIMLRPLGRGTQRSRPVGMLKCIPRLDRAKTMDVPDGGRGGGTGLERDQLLLKLKEFHLLEIYQVDFYRGLISSFDDERTRMAYTHMAAIEQGHVDYFAGKLREMGVEPSGAFGDLAALAGRLTAKVMDLTVPENRHRLGVFYETTASRMYLEFINLVKGEGDGELHKTLWFFRTDEEFHLNWMAAEIEAAKEKAGDPVRV